MARSNNFLLGRGEALTHKVSVRSGGGEKNSPYTFADRRERLTPRLMAATDAFRELPVSARPGGQVVAVVTMHPRYISKSDFPADLLNAFELQLIGSRTRKISPEKWGIKDPPEAGLANDIFVAGTISAFSGWSRELPRYSASVKWADDLTHIEDIAAFTAAAKLRGVQPQQKRQAFEVVIHNAHSRRIINQFQGYAREVGVEPLEGWRRDVGGLTFFPVRATAEQIVTLAQFSFVRVARPLPRLRVLGPDIVRLGARAAINLPDDPPLDEETRVVIFDGGLPPSVDLSRWVTLIEPDGIGIPKSDYQEHGLAVTSALLFGNLKDGVERRPLCRADHVRVLDAGAANAELEYLEVLNRIVMHLETTRGRYEFGSISVGPQLPIADDEITQWTAQLDEFHSDGAMLTSVAVGNDGEENADFDLNRIQPPSDGVNILAVGACDSDGGVCRRASYSCIGPGRTPGYVKPDGLAFAGAEGRPYFVLTSQPSLCITGASGTSIAAPHALRSGIAVRTQLGGALTPLAIRALMVHRAEGGEDVESREVGWGRFLDDYSALITCEDDEALIIYQGVLPVESHLRAPIPLPKKKGLQGRVEITATLVIATEVDPEHAGAYTRSGMLVSFRPHAGKYREYGDGTRSQHPKTESFFSMKNMVGASEYEQQEFGHKWEPCIRATRRKSAKTLFEPCFDIDYQHRDGVDKAVAPLPVSYALVVSVRAPKVPDLYNRVRREYASILEPIQPRIRIPIKA